MARSMIRRAVDFTVSALPLKASLLYYAAQLPSALRSKLSIRVLSAINRRTLDRPPLSRTNLGIHSQVDCLIPNQHSELLFGAPRFWTGERSTLALSDALLDHCACYLDVGSNLGIYPLYLCSRGHRAKPIFCFEPDPELVELLRVNIKENGLANVAVQDVAVSRASGKVRFFANLSDKLSGTLVPDNWTAHTLAKPIEIPSVALSDFVANHRLNAVCAKIDVEGAEDQVWEGLVPSLQRFRFVIMEILGPAIKIGLPRRIIQESGFHAYYIHDYQLEHSRDGSFEYVPPFYNWLFCRETPQQLKGLLKPRFKVV